MKHFNKVENLLAQYSESLENNQHYNKHNHNLVIDYISSYIDLCI